MVTLIQDWWFEKQVDASEFQVIEDLANLANLAVSIFNIFKMNLSLCQTQFFQILCSLSVNSFIASQVGLSLTPISLLFLHIQSQLFCFLNSTFSLLLRCTFVQIAPPTKKNPTLSYTSPLIFNNLVHVKHEQLRPSLLRSFSHVPFSPIYIRDSSEQSM